MSGPGGGGVLGPGREFDLIRAFIGRGGPLPSGVRVGPGDDAAVLEGGWVISSDLSVEGVHFRRDWIADEEIGYRAAAAALSDLAAMAADPVALLVSLAAPAEGADLHAIQAGVRAAAADFGGSVIGGDLSRSPGPTFLDVVVLGRTEWPILRNGAEPGDEVWVTGHLGGSAAAVELWQSGAEPGPELRAAYARPRPRVAEVRCLVEHELVDALIDVSDGLLGDLGHVAAASGVRIVVDASAVPVSPAAESALGADRARSLALGGGEDFEVAFVTDPGVVDAHYFRERHGFAVTRVGIVEEGEAVWLRDADGAVAPTRGMGWDHWGSTAG